MQIRGSSNRAAGRDYVEDRSQVNLSVNLYQEGLVPIQPPRMEIDCPACGTVYSTFGEMHCPDCGHGRHRQLARECARCRSARMERESELQQHVMLAFVILVFLGAESLVLFRGPHWSPWLTAITGALGLLLIPVVLLFVARWWGRRRSARTT